MIHRYGVARTGRRREWESDRREIHAIVRNDVPDSTLHFGQGADAVASQR